MEIMKKTIKLYGAIGVLILLIITDVIMFTQENWQEMWVAIAFVSAFSVGFLIYINSMKNEIKRLKNEKIKRKGK